MCAFITLTFNEFFCLFFNSILTVDRYSTSNTKNSMSTTLYDRIIRNSHKPVELYIALIEIFRIVMVSSYKYKIIVGFIQPIIVLIIYILIITIFMKAETAVTGKYNDTVSYCILNTNLVDNLIIFSMNVSTHNNRFHIIKTIMVYVFVFIIVHFIY